MTKKQKLLDGIRNNPKGVRFEDALKAAELIGFTSEGGSGSHQTRSRPGEPYQLNFQKLKDGKAKPYQVGQLIKMMDKYEGHDDE